MCAKLDATGLLADMAYAVFQGEAPAGRERCHLYRRAKGGYWMTAELDLAWPFLHHEYLELQSAPDWRPESLVVRLSGDQRRDGVYRADGLTWQATIQTDQETVERAVPWGTQTCLETSSICSYIFTVNRIEFPSEALSASAELSVVLIDLPSLEPVLVRRRYDYLGPERITTPAGDWLATHYAVAGATHLWADSHSVMVAAHRMIGGKPHDYKLLEYHWLG